ncbi:chain length-determining protein [Seongchinamella sediminis]|uniref:Chain length-determining protein n=1 Tax=Seongchinamella sediminis TaxID=2283635 RepID=A0A3L7DW16_9GAMM|nr:XrtA system polysaccharide chain length determinant [Seongchinamella sediminis]RLQ20749.1 chain length-determining protein [Seongchinamella sediminis]
MQELLAQVFTYVWAAWRHRWLALAVTWVVAIGGWLFVWQLPEAYVATARVYVDTNSILRPLLRGLTVQPDIQQRVSMMSQTLLSRPNLEKLMRMTDLDLEANTEAQKNDILADLSEAITLTGDRRNPSLYSISVEDEDRNTARRIAQALITVFIESSLGSKRAESSGAQSFLEEQIAEYEERLVAAENRLARFKQENVDVLQGRGDFYATLQAAREDLSAARLMLSEMENRRSELARQLEEEDPVLMPSEVTGDFGSMSPLDTRIENLRTSLDELSIRYTDKHPEVRQLTEMIEHLEERRDEEFTRVSTDPAMTNSPVYQGMRSMLTATEANVAELQVRVAEYEQRVANLESKVNHVPEIEARLKQLDRDYNVLLGQQQQLLQRRESARMSEDVEQNASDVTFRVIDPPFVPQTPSEPNKTLLNAGVLLLSLGAGAGVALLISMLNPVIIDGRMLTDVTGLPLLGTVTMNLLPEQKRKETLGLLTFSALAGFLLVVYVGMSLVQGGVPAS